MKKTMLLLWCCCVLYTQAQKNPNGNAADANAAQNSIRYEVLSSIEDISTSKMPWASSLIVQDSVRGGVFNAYRGSDIADNGMIFQDASGKKWVRQTDGTGVLNARWYGIRNAQRGLTDAQNDMWDKMVAAQNYIWKHNKEFSTLLLPSDYSGYKYIFMSKPDTIKNPLIISGNGSYGAPYSSIEWYNQTTGFYIPALQENGDGNLFSLKNLRLTQYIKNYTDTIHLVIVRCKFNFENVDIKSASGDGIHVLATSFAGGNANQSFMSHVQVTDCNNGVYIEGADANIITSYTCSYVSNRRWGYWDNSLLGTSNYSGHWSNNGKVVNHETVVQYPKGTYWRCTADGGVTDKRPDLYPAFWQKVTAMGDGMWDKNKKYFSGGPYKVSNINARTTFYSPYTESFQPPAVLSQSSHSIDGDQGAGVDDDSGVFENTYGNQKIVSANLFIPSPQKTSSSRLIGLGTSNPQPDAIVTIHANSAKSNVINALDLRSDTNAVWMRAINSVSSGGYLGYSANSWITYAGDKSVLTTSPSEFRPSFNSTIDLGTSLFHWKKVYGDTYYADKLNITTGSNASLGSGTLIKGSATISTKAVTASSKIFVTLTNCNNCGTVYIGTINAGTSFIVNSSNSNDNSSFNWWIVN